MAKGIRVCKVCGNKYEYCHTARLNGEMFRWQDVACCPEHGSIYFAKIIASRLKDSAPAEDAHSIVDDDAKIVEEYEQRRKILEEGGFVF